MQLLLLLLFGTASILVNSNGSVLVCSNTKCEEINIKINNMISASPCHCFTENKTLTILCYTSAEFNTTNIIVPDSLLKDISSVQLKLIGTAVTQLTNPFMSQQLANLLQLFELRKHKISKIDAGIFDKLPNLHTLILSENEMEDKLLSNTWLTASLGKSLKSIDLSANYFKKIPKSCFDNLRSLKELYLNFNKIEEISDFVLTSLSNLQILDLSDNMIRVIPANSFKGLSGLIDLRLNLNNIEEIANGGFSSLSNLERLDLDENNISVIPNSNAFSQPNKLKYLSLYSNKISQIEKGTFDNMNLENIELSVNHIEQIYDGVFDMLHNLKYLGLEGNRNLKLSDKTFGPDGLINLNRLHLGICNLKSLSNGVFKNIPKLAFLDLNGNQFTSVPTAIRNAKSLRNLDLSSNDIVSINANAFGNNPFLEELYLNSLSKLNTIADCSFCGLTGLTDVYLNNGNLNQINENAFGFLKQSTDKTANISRIEIHDSELKTVPLKLLPWENMTISILGNPANCDARMDWLFRNKNYKIDTKPTPRYYDRKWCEQCKHDQVCQKLYGWKDPTTKSPVI